MKKIGILFFYLLCFAGSAQTQFSNSKSIVISITNDSIQVSTVSISPVNFKVYDKDKLIPSNEYTIDFGKAILTLDSKKYNNLRIDYTAYPDFLTKKYAPLSKNLITSDSNNTTNMFRLSDTKKEGAIPFQGLYTQGSLARGITVGNNQDAVTNSSLDLQISGKISKDVTIKASISDSNIPIQKNGYSQQIEEFDRVFIELFTNQWSLKAGDINLSNQETNFLLFDKKVAGLSVDVTPTKSDSENHFKASGALVRGRFTRHQFTGVDGNQGPYRLLGPNNETFIVILSGSETIYVNGTPLKRGAQNDYTIDYNLSEITFTTTFPITSNMRISAEFQYSDRNYTRFVSYNKASHKSEKLEIGGYFYTESDAKDQPLQQNLSEKQKETLGSAGNDTSKMRSESAFPEAYDENKILYKKTTNGAMEIFEFSQNPEDELYAVTFSFIEDSSGSYQLLETTAIGRIFEYTGPGSGNYAPIVQLVAPTKLQVVVANIKYNPTKKTALDTEVAFSDNNQNLFSSIDNENNKGLAAKVGWSQIYSDKKWLVKSTINLDYLEQNFKSIQRIYNVEFARDWNLLNPTGTQEFIRSELLVSNKKNNQFSYHFESLKYGDTFSGTRHLFNSDIALENTTINANISFLENESTLEKSTFLKANASIKHFFKTSWIGAIFSSEDNQRTDVASQKLNILSQKFLKYGAFIGIGDSTKVYVKTGIDFRNNDSVKNEQLARVNNSKNYYINSKLIQNKNTQVGIYMNYRTVENIYQENINSLNSRVNYSQKLFQNFIRLTTVYETSSGTSPQQQFAYIKTEPGQGFYTWIDYNSNGIQEFEEFEIAKFSDQADYLRVTLPSINYIKINQTKFSQSLNINPLQWSSSEGIKKILSQFSNQSYILVDTKKEREGSGFDLNPFDTKNPSVLGLINTLKNSFFFRRGLQHYSTTYMYSKSQTKNNLGIGFQENTNTLRQLSFQHKLGAFWLLDLKGGLLNTLSNNENFSDRNYEINSQEVNPLLTYSFSKNSNFSLNYEYKDKDEILTFSTLELHKVGTSYQYAHPKKGAILADFNLYKNTFIGNQNSPIAYEMLEGLQPGNNYVWNLIAQKKLTSYLHLNINYSGRKSETSKTIHTGSVQIRAVF
jgi:hypothetical protein